MTQAAQTDENLGCLSQLSPDNLKEQDRQVPAGTDETEP